MAPKLNILTILIFIVFLLTGPSCKKDWLNAKPDLALIEPTTVQDYQSLLDNTFVIAGGNSINFNNNQPSLGEISGGEYFVTAPNFGTLTPLEKNAYLWSPDLYNGSDNYSDWQWAYKRIFTTNVILEGLSKIKVEDETEVSSFNNVKGAAYFFRGYNHFNVAQLFCQPYDKASSKKDLGIPLKLKSDVLAASYRPTVEETYQQILE
ncbi:MAG: RagB/SusD family nutrient uptake outer membrane protein, partial [Niastella sp.]|nr:RagB/SusD family nutrient uptake outer membrane protein [Niastella sp.]